MKRLISAVAIIGLTVGLLFFHVNEPFPVPWFMRWVYLMAVGTFVVGIWIGNRTHYTLMPFAWVVGASAVWIGFWGLGQVKAGQAISLYMGKIAIYNYCIFLFAAMFVLQFPKRYQKTIEWCLVIMCVMSVGYTFLQLGAESGVQRTAFGDVAGMSGCLMACSLPFVLKYIPSLWGRAVMILLTAVAVFSTEASNPVGVLGGVLAVYCFITLRCRKVIKVIVGGLICAGMLAVGFLIQGPSLFSSSGRFTMWKTVILWFFDHANCWWGVGLGTTQSLFPDLQDKVEILKFQGMYLWFHSEPVQLLWDLGINGVVTAIPVVIYFLWHARRSKELMSSLTGVLLASLFNYPFRHPLLVVVFLGTCYLIQNQRGTCMPLSAGRSGSAGGRGRP